MTSTTKPPKRSIPLSEKQLADLKKRIDKYDSLTEASFDLKVARDVLIRLQKVGSCNEITYKKLFGEDSVPSSDS